MEFRRAAESDITRLSRSSGRVIVTVTEKEGQTRLVDRGQLIDACKSHGGWDTELLAESSLKQRGGKD